MEKVKLKTLNYSSGLILSWILVLLPLAFWLLKNPLVQNFNSLAAVAGSLANLTALIGLAAMAWSLILADRSRLLEGLFNGLDKMYQAHQYFGKLAFYLILLHPIFLSIRSSSRGRNPLALWLFNDSWALNLGRLSLYAFIIIIIVTVYIHLRHRNFLQIHRLLGFVFLLGGLHTFLIKGRLTANPILKYYLLILSAFAVYTFVYRSLLGRLFIKTYKYKVVKMRNLGSLTNEVTLEPLTKPMNFTPGQFAFVKFLGHMSDKESHPYSMASSNHERQLKFVIKALGDYTNEAYMINVDDQVLVEGPYGKFSYLNGKKRQQIWIAGGIGITPFLSMARSLSPIGGYKIDLYYAARSELEVFYLGELDSIVENAPGFNVITHPENTQGLINLDVLTKHSDNLLEHEIFICGPPPMMKSLETQLEKTGVPKKQIHFEQFRF